MRTRYVRELESQRDFWKARAIQLEGELVSTRLECENRLERAHDRELELFDKALKRHGSTPIRREEPPDIPPPIPSTEEIAYAEDWMNEYLEVFPQASRREAAEYYRAYLDGRYDPKTDPRLPISFDGGPSQASN